MESLLQLQSVLKELLVVQDDERLSSLCDSALQLLQDLPSMEHNTSSGKAMALSVYTDSITLWNKAVALRSAGAVPLSLNAQMRQISFSLMLLSNPLEPNETNLIKQITMASKTGRAWLDCDNAAMAENSLALAIDCWEKLYARYPSVSKEPAKMKFLFRVLCFRAEANVSLGQHDQALQYIQQAKELLSRLDQATDAPYLAMMCYNFGLDQYQKEPNENCIIWLKESYDIGRDCTQLGAAKLAKTLRLLANAFLDINSKEYWSKALNAVNLANSEHSHPSGFMLKTNILLEHDSSDNESLNHCYRAALEHQDLSLDMGISTVRLVSKYNKKELAFTGLATLAKRFQSSPDVSRIHLLHLDILLENNQYSEAQNLVEDCITAHNTGSPIERDYMKQFHTVFWEQASKASDKGDHHDALLWYNYSLSLFSTDAEKDKNIAKLQRNRCCCFIELSEYDKAAEAIQQSKSHDPDCPLTHFLAFKLALIQGKQEEATDALSCVVMTCASSEEDNALIYLAAQMSIERNNRELAVLSLEKVATVCKDPQIFTALRCLIRLKLVQMNSRSSDKVITLRNMLGYIQAAQGKLSLISSPIARQKEANWFLKMAWNLALQCEDNYQEMRDLYLVCYSLSECLTMDPSILMRQKTCQLMAAAACINIGRSAESSAKTTAFKDVLDYVLKCRELCKQLGVSSVQSDPTPSLLALYEFEAKLELGHTDTSSMLEHMSKLPIQDTKILESMAALCVRCSQTNMAVEILKLAIQHHLKDGDLDGEKLSKCYHSVVQLVMGSSSSDMVSKELALSVLNEVLSLLDTRAKESFPEIEILWLMTKAWNCGMHLYSAMRFKDSELWCSVALRFLNHLSQLKAAHEHHMNTVYTAVINKVQSN